MKMKKLKIGKPCKEDWNNMIPNQEGHFCDSCSKTVIDFTQLSQNEILKKLKTEKGNICVRMTEAQLDAPFLEFKETKQYSLPYSKTAASIMLAASMIGTQSCFSESRAQTPIVQTSTNSIAMVKSNELTKTDNLKSISTSIFKGKIISEKTGLTIENAEITYISLQEIYTTYTNKKGEFTLDIPLKLIKNSNVVRITFRNIKGLKVPMNIPDGKDVVLSRSQIENYYTYIAKREYRRIHGERPEGVLVIHHPIVIVDGKEIEYEEFERGQKEGVFKHGVFYSIHSIAATALYGKKAEHGLYLFIEN